MIKSITPEKYFESMTRGDSRKLKVVVEALREKLDNSTLDPRTKIAINEKLFDFFNTKDPRNIPNPGRLLTFTPVEASLLFSWNAPKIMEAFQNEQTFTEIKVEDLVTGLLNAEGIVPGPKQVRCGLDLQNGHYVRKETSKYVGQAQILCTLLNNIPRGTLSPTNFNYQGIDITIKEPRDLLDALISTGHRIELTQERMYADFLSLSLPEISLAWPSWVDTGLNNGNGGNVCLPITHCQYSWLFNGPLVNTKITFFLGTGGVGFIPEVYDTPDWKFFRTYQRFSTDEDAEKIYKALDLASLFIKDVESMVGNAPNDGYGFSGVCTDSAAFIEMGLTGTLTLYPTLRNTNLAKTQRIPEAIEIAQRIPLDTDLAADATQAIDRMLETHPPEDNWNEIEILISPRLKSDLEALKRVKH
jgi:hypothetical protein